MQPFYTKATKFMLHPHLPKIALGFIFTLGFLLPLPILVNSPLHHDEALYAYWAQLISSQRDPMLNTVAVDKPPLFLYTVALFFQLFGPSETVARFPSLLAHLATVWLTYRLGQILYNPRLGRVAALLIALSPFQILFAPTALTDPLLVMLVMLASLAAINNKVAWAALSLGLAVATKQQGLFFLPLILGLLIVGFRIQKRESGNDVTPPSRGVSLGQPANPLLLFSLVLVFTLAIPLIWDANRTYETGFWQQSALSYGGLSLTGQHIWSRFLSFIDLMALITATPILNLIFVIGVPILWLLGSVNRQVIPKLHHQSDSLLSGFCLAFVLFHACFSFQVWDRYLLGLVPFLCILLARVLHLPEIFLKSGQLGMTVCAWGIILIMLRVPVQNAMREVYPLGGDHGSFHGVAEITTYLQGHAGANVTLYHHWLGTHWRYYLLGYPYDLRYWETTAHLAEQAQSNASGIQYLGVPSWQSTTPLELALFDVGLKLRLVYRTYRNDGTPAIYLYEIVSDPNRKRAKTKKEEVSRLGPNMTIRNTFPTMRL